MEQITSDSGWHGSPDVYESLLDAGIEAVKIQPLAKKLNLSRTSFWFFKNREELRDRLVSRWREKNTGNLVRQSELRPAWVLRIATKEG
jgi:AcrR family transcriptional regulator